MLTVFECDSLDSLQCESYINPISVYQAVQSPPKERLCGLTLSFLIILQVPSSSFKIIIMKRLLFLLNRRWTSFIILLMTANLSYAGYYSFKVDGVYYKVLKSTSWGDSENEVGVYGDEFYRYYNGDVVIPEYVNNGGRTYKVTTVLSGCFCYDGYSWGRPDYTSITLPATIRHIEYHAFGPRVPRLILLGPPPYIERFPSELYDYPYISGRVACSRKLSLANNSFDIDYDEEAKSKRYSDTRYYDWGNDFSMYYYGDKTDDYWDEDYFTTIVHPLDCFDRLVVSNDYYLDYLNDLSWHTNTGGDYDEQSIYTVVPIDSMAPSQIEGLYNDFCNNVSDNLTRLSTLLKEQRERYSDDDKVLNYNPLLFQLGYCIWVNVYSNSYILDYTDGIYYDRSSYIWDDGLYYDRDGFLDIDNFDSWAKLIRCYAAIFKNSKQNYINSDISNRLIEDYADLEDYAERAGDYIWNHSFNLDWGDYVYMRLFQMSVYDDYNYSLLIDDVFQGNDDYYDIMFHLYYDLSRQICPFSNSIDMFKGYLCNVDEMVNRLTLVDDALIQMKDENNGEVNESFNRLINNRDIVARKELSLHINIDSILYDLDRVIGDIPIIINRAICDSTYSSWKEAVSLPETMANLYFEKQSQMESMISQYETSLYELENELNDFITAVNIPVDKERVSNQWILLDGKMIQGSPDRPGIYLYEGKKIQIKYRN